MDLNNIPIQVLFESKKDDPINKLFKLMKPIQYGWYGNNNRKYHEGNWAREDDVDGDILWWTTYKVMSPQEVWKHKVGTCIDQSIFEQSWLKKNAPHINTSLTWIECYDSSDHMWLTFEENGKLFWFEHSWGPYAGTHGPYNSIKEIVKHVYQRNGSKKGYKYLELGEYKWKPNMNAEQFLEEMKYEWKKEGWKKIDGHWVQLPESPNK